ncbi:MAG: MFS transporter [Legionellales bacterium]|nr:MFS transporter [Legionellales bacterium]
MPESRVSWRAWLALSGLALVSFMINIDFTAVNIALMPISHDLATQLNTIQWILSAYVLTWGALVLPAGHLCEVIGRRRSFLIGVGLFMVASLWCGFTRDSAMMIIARIFQGIGAACFIPAAYSIAYSLIPDSRRGLALGMVSTGVGLGLALGPLLGGFIVKFFTWPWIFWMNIPIGLVAFLIIFFVVAREKFPFSHKKPDWLGMGLLIACYLLLILSITHTEYWSRYSDAFSVLIYLGLVALVLLIVTQAHTPTPLFPSIIFNRNFMSATFGFMCLQYNFAAIVFLANLALLNVMLISSYECGFMFLAMTVFWALLSPAGGYLQDKLNPRAPILLGVALLSVALLILFFITPQSSTASLISAFVLMGLGFGLAFPGYGTLMLRSSSAKVINTATAFYTMIGLIGATLGVVFSSVVLLHYTRKIVITGLTEQAIHLTAYTQHQLNTILVSTNMSSIDLNSLPSQVRRYLELHLHVSYLSALRYAFGLNIIVALLGLWFCSLMTPARKYVHEKNHQTSYSPTRI